MHLSLHIAQGDAGRVAGKQSTSNGASLNRCVRPAIAARAYYRTRSAAANLSIRESAPGDASPSTGA